MGEVGQDACGAFGVFGVADGDFDELGPCLVFELVSRALGDDFSKIDNCDLVGELVGFFEVLGREQDGCAFANEGSDDVPEFESGTGDRVL